jgi:predicted amidohydrolase YtcJ
MSKKHGVLFACLGFAAAALATTALGASQPAAADLILHNARAWTVDPARAEAEAVAVRGGRIVKVGTSSDVLGFRGPSTRVIDLGGKLLLPGFIDAHTHFENACDWVSQVSLFDVNDEAELIRRLREAAARVPKGMWITGGDWGAYSAWDRARGKPVAVAVETFNPSLSAVDAAVPDHPVLLRRHDWAYFANSLALARGRFTGDTPDPRGGSFGRDPARAGALTGMLYGRAGERMAQLMPPPSLDRKLHAARVALADLNRLGITGIHDIARVDSLSEDQVFHTAVERSSSNLDIFLELRKRGELTVRVFPQLTIATFRGLKARGIEPRDGDDLIRYGVVKGFVDGYLMKEPYEDDPKFSGSFSFRYTDDASMERDVVAADASGYDSAFHVIGDRAIGLVLDWYEAAVRVNPARDRRFRLVHVWYPTAADIERAGRLKVIADITPYHLVRDMATVDRHLGSRRARTAHAWRTLLNAGVRMNLVSDWPGSYNEQEHTPINPLENIYYAVTRQALDARAAAGPWHPEEHLTLREAIEAYTMNPAYSSYEEKTKGSITEGKLADFVVLSKDILDLPPAELMTTSVLYTIVGGKVVYQKHQ